MNHNITQSYRSLRMNKKTSRERGLSTVWFLPLVALIITAWLGYKTYSEKGPVVIISFDEAAGIEVGKTKLKYKDIEIGIVSDLAFSDDLERVQVTAKFGKEAKQHLNENTRFWVVRPRIGASGVSGLSTLLSGAYIQVDPGDGEPSFNFVGLENPPVVQRKIEGREFKLRASDLGFLHAGAPIYYRGIRAGEIITYDFSPDMAEITFHVFIESPFHDLVTSNTRFWNLSGVELDADANGINVRAGTLQSILSGGIAFDSFGDQPSDLDAAEENSEFRLYRRYEETSEKIFETKLSYVLFFDSSVRGLQVGAPVDFRGIKLGRVSDIKVFEDPDTLDIFIPVTIELEPERIPYSKHQQITKPPEEVIAELIRRGLRGQLKTGSLLTGQLFVELEFHPASEMKLSDIKYHYPEIPTVPSTITEIKETITRLAGDIQGLPLKDIAKNVLNTTAGLDRLVNDPATAGVIQATNGALTQAKNTLVDAQQTLETMTKTLNTVDGVIAPDSPLQYDLAKMMMEFTSTAQSVRALTSYLERHPEALISGKK